MKRSFGPLIIAVLCLLFLISATLPASAEGEVSIKDALESGDISVRFVSKGAASGHVADLLIESNSASDITLDLANSGLEGMVLANPYDEEQDEVITETPGVSTGGASFDPQENVTLGPGQSVIIPVIGYCMNFDKATPSTSIEFSLSSTSLKTSINEVSSIIDTLEGYDFPESWGSGHIQRVKQMAIWTSQQDNNEVPLSRYSERGYSLNEEDIEIVKDILNLSGKDFSDVAALTGLEKEDDAEGGGILDEIPWFAILLIIAAIILAAIISGARSMRRRRRRKGGPHHPKTAVQLKALEYYKKKRKECQKLNEKCREAQQKAREAEQKAKERTEDADEAKSASEKAKSEREKTELEFEEFDMDKKEKEESWAESDGTRITSYDLKLKNEASKALWKQYQDGEIDAQTLEKVWEDLGEKDALKELRKKDKEDRELPLKDALEQAKLLEAEAKSKAEAAQGQAQRANDYAKKAREYADKVCRKAHECNEEAKTAYEAAGFKSETKAAPSKVKDKKKKKPEKEADSQEEPEEPEEPEIEAEDDEKDEDDLEIEEDAVEDSESEEKKDQDSSD